MSSEAESASEPSAGGAGDQARQALVDKLKEHLGQSLLASEVARDDVWARVDRAAWRQAGQVCRDHLGMDYFCFLSGLDWKPNPDLSGEKIWDPSGGVELDSGGEEGSATGDGHQTGVTGGDTRFQVMARVYSTSAKSGVTLKADLEEDDPRVESWVEVYRGADWHERETWEMFGFLFDGHPSLRHMYLPGEFEGHPLRKDFPLLAREVKPWPGLVDVEAMPGEEEAAGDASDGASETEEAGT